MCAGVLAVADDVGLLRAGAAERVVAPAGVRDDRHQRRAVEREQARAEAEVGRALLAQRVDGAVAVGVVVRVEEQRVDGLVAVQVDDPQRLPRGELADPALAGGDVDGQPGAGRIARLPTAVLMQRRLARGEAALVLGAGGADRVVGRAAGARVRSGAVAPAARCHSGAGSSGCGALASTTSVSSSKRSVDARRPAASGRCTKRERPVVGDRHLGEEVDVGDEVALRRARAWPARRAARSRALRRQLVAGLLVAAARPQRSTRRSRRVEWPVIVSCQPQLSCDDRRQHAPHVRVQGDAARSAG